MATKAKNRKTVEKLVSALGLGMEVPKLDDQNASYWADLVSDLKAKQRDASRETDADKVVEVEPEIEAPKKVAKVENTAVVAYCVKPGGSITSLKGILVAGMPIEAQDLSGDDPQSSFDNLIDKGYVVEVK